MAPQGALRADMASANPNFTSIHRSSCSPSPPAYGRIISSNRLAAHTRKGSSSTQRSRIIWLRKDAAFQSFSGLRPAHLAPSRQLKACDKRILREVVRCDASKISQGEFTEMAWQAVVALPEVAKESNQQIVETEDLMKALLEQRNGLVRRISAKANVDNTFFYQAIERCIQRQSKVHLRRSPTGFFWSRKFGGKDLLVLGRNSSELMSLPTSWCLGALLVAASNFPVFLSLTDAARAESSHQEVHQIYGDLSSGIELGVQVLYLAFLLSLVGVASFFVVRQLLIRRELETAARDLQDRVRTGEALPVEYFELGAVMLRKKFFVLASKYLEQAINKWDGDPQDLAQVHNALGYSLVCDNKLDKGIAEYEKAVKLQPGYVVAWNNLGSAYEKKKNLPKALQAYEQALLFDPNNRVAREYRDALKKRVDRLAGVPTKYD